MELGGLGVCSTQGKCADSNDDQISLGGSVFLEISGGPIFVGDIYFCNGGHGLTFADDAIFGVRIDSTMDIEEFALAEVVSTSVGRIVNTGIEFLLAGNNSDDHYDFYVTGFGTPVLVLASLPMMLMGLLGLRI